MDRTLRKLLVVEDEAYVVERVKGMLKKYNFSIDFASEAKKAKELLLNPYDVVITSVYVYGITSLEINKLAHDKNKDALVIVTTNLSNIDLAQKTVKEGAFDYVIKPQELEKIESLVKVYLITKG
jgi:two-component system response regulator PilR (NtrC family)